MRNLLIRRPITTLSSHEYHVIDLGTKQPIHPLVSIRRHHFFSLSYDVMDNASQLIGTLSPTNLFRDTWQIKDTLHASHAVLSRQIPDEWFTEYTMVSEGETVCVFRQSNTISATEFVAIFAPELVRWSENLLISIPLAMMASNPLICSWRSEAQGGSG